MDIYVVTKTTVTSKLFLNVLYIQLEIKKKEEKFRLISHKQNELLYTTLPAR